RRHYFEVVVRPLTNVAQFGPGWYAPEGQGMDEWRWMAGRSTATLPPAGGDTVLRLYFILPGELAAKSPEVTVTLNGKLIDHFNTTEQYLSRDYHVTPNADRVNVLQLAIDRTMRADSRDLGLQVRFISWGPG
ncbi:MAG TPA: hypothetical protein VLU46_16820, partial [Thermoanaerobaculia bacterium]|nr:hypothetical protein [Thermoanaerobaculia bacterium]